MKNFIFLLFTFFSLSVFADPEHEGDVTPQDDVLKLAALSTLENAIPEGDHKVLETIKNDLLYNRLGIDKKLQPINFSSAQKDLIGMYLDQIFAHCTWLKYINLSEMKLAYLPKSIGRLGALEHLDLGQNNLRFIPNELLKLPKLKKVILTGNPMRGMSLELLAELEKRGNDYHLDADRRERMKKGYAHYDARLQFANYLFSVFERATKAILFDELVGGYLGYYPNGKEREHDEKTKKFVKKKLAKIVKNVPYMTHANLSGYELSEVPEIVKDWLQLKVMLLSNNDLIYLPEFFQGLRSLEKLDLSYNRFTYFPSALHECESIEELILHHNDIEDFLPKDVHIPNLQMLDLSHTKLKVFPKDRVNFPKLKRLNLSKSKIKRLTHLYPICPQVERVDIEGVPLQALPPEFEDTAFGITDDKKSELLAMHKRVETVNLLLFLVEFDKKELAEEMVRGCIGIKENGALRTLTDAEKDFVVSNIDYIVQVLPWLSRLNLQFLKLRKVPAALQNLSELEVLDLRHNYIKELPDFIENCKELRQLFLSNNEFSVLPKGLNKLKKLTTLHLSNNQIRVLDEDLTGLAQIRVLTLSGNLIRSLPESLYELDNLTTLLLSNTPITSLSPHISGLVNLKKLALSNTQIDEVPLEVGRLQKLKVLQVNNGRMKTLPYSLKNLGKLTCLEINEHALQPQSDHTGMGYKEIATHFEKTVTLSPNRTIPEIGYTHENQVYALMDQKRLSWNRERLKSVMVPDIPERKLTGAEMLKEWQAIWKDMNINDEGKPGYLDYYMLTQSKADKDEKRDNVELMNQEFVPRMRGFLKAVYGLKLSEGEIFGWVISPNQKQAMQNVIAVIFKHLLDTQDLDQRGRIFIQFVAGALMCQTGQKNNFETILLSLSEGSDAHKMVNVEYFDTQLESLVAYEKEKKFRRIANDTSNKQSVHLYEYYKTRLSRELGLRSALRQFKDIHGIQGADPFGGSTGNVLLAFYQTFTPEDIITKVLSGIATEKEIELIRKKDKTEKEQELVEKIKSSKPYRFASIVSYMTDNGLLTQHDLRDEDNPDAERPKWEGYFEGHPHDDGSVLKPKAIEDIMVHMDLVLNI